MTLTPEQQRAHATGIGGSEAAAACGKDPYRTRYQLYLDKIGEGEAVPESDAIWIGNSLEFPLLKWAMETTGDVVEHAPPVVRHPSEDIMFCSLDGRSMADPKIIYECKTGGVVRGVFYDPDEWGEPGTDEIPVKYLIQCQHNMACAKADICRVPALVGGRGRVLYEVQRNDALIAAIVSMERDFWKCVIDRTPPAPETEKDVRLRWPEDIGSTAIAGGDILADARRILDLRDQVAALKSEQDDCEFRVKRYMADAATLDGPNGAMFTFKTNKAGKRIFRAVKGAY